MVLRLRGPDPSPAAVVWSCACDSPSAAGEAWLSCVLPTPPSASRGCPYAVPLVLEACCTPARVCISLSFVLAALCPIVCTGLSRRPSAALADLQELLYQSLHALVAFESVTPEQPPPSSHP